MEQNQEMMRMKNQALKEELSRARQELQDELSQVRQELQEVRTTLSQNPQPTRVHDLGPTALTRPTGFTGPTVPARSTVGTYAEVTAAGDREGFKLHQSKSTKRRAGQQAKDGFQKVVGAMEEMRWIVITRDVTPTTATTADITHAMNSKLLKAGFPTHVRIQKLGKSVRGNYTCLTAPSATASMVLQIHEQLLQAVKEQDSGITDIRADETWTKLKVHGISLAEYMWGDGSELQLFKKALKAGNEVKVPFIRWLLKEELIQQKEREQGIWATSYWSASRVEKRQSDSSTRACQQKADATMWRGSAKLNQTVNAARAAAEAMKSSVVTPTDWDAPCAPEATTQPITFARMRAAQQVKGEGVNMWKRSVATAVKITQQPQEGVSLGKELSQWLRRQGRKGWRSCKTAQSQVTKSGDVGGDMKMKQW